MVESVLIAVASALQAYLLGSIDTGILISKFVYHDDVRNHGSGAAGMTNMLRTFGKKAAALTAVGDVLKGALAVCIGRALFGLLPADTSVSPYLAVYLAAIFAVLGHLYPLYFGFKGGKGVLVAGGAVLAIQPVLLPFLAAIFLVCLIPTGMVSLGSVTMAALYPRRHPGCAQSPLRRAYTPPPPDTPQTAPPRTANDRATKTKTRCETVRSPPRPLPPPCVSPTNSRRLSKS